MLPFNRPLVFGTEKKYLAHVLAKRKLSGDGELTGRCRAWIESTTLCSAALLTTSGTHALDMAALLSDIKTGDEVIMPSFTFPSTANAFVLRGGKIVFVDIRPDTMNIDEKLIEGAITARTKVIVPVHYAGVSCEMDTIIALARKHKLLVVEDAAQGVMSTYKGKHLGAIGDMGCYSFHETKNYTCGEGGALLLRDARFVKRAEIIREKGTNRTQFHRGDIRKYTWVDVGSSYLPSELNAACLFAQLEAAEKIQNKRMKIWNHYFQRLEPLRAKGILKLPFIPEGCSHNGHMFYIKLSNRKTRDKMIDYLDRHGVMSVHHYIPLHSSVAGKKFGKFHGTDCYTTKESERLLRLPMFYGLRVSDVDKICRRIHAQLGSQ